MRAFAAVAIIAGVASADGHGMMTNSTMPMDGGMEGMMNTAERVKVVQDLIDVFCGEYDLP